MENKRNLYDCNIQPEEIVKELRSFIEEDKSIAGNSFKNCVFCSIYVPAFVVCAGCQETENQGLVSALKKLRDKRIITFKFTEAVI